ncbi:NAD dependent epimerase/dehydratase family protein [Aspergillus bombycis]|uniref:NAD dependent epimerase/dehydratase family protein n=1 Tax=Aspergillus bombycis TaxID=109264 RepID=A0A1F7ZRX4_9EURO|nr:NAD dependent epimerase/dehydratase family protein [Aspergillus bombycis]OGM42211.1 NAD dependent epimerase/dehydratase family protein [Aspergillus bombycis]
MPTAIVTGATGITGSAIVHHLLKDSSYEKIYSFSRSSPGVEHQKIQHVSLNLQSSAEDMAHSLHGISADYIFFCAYLAKEDPDELSRVNSTLLSNFLKALAISGADKRLKRFILTCGFKQYGVHLGPGKQRALAQGQWEWVITLPEDVLGYARGNFMNETTSIGLYCAVSKALPGSELPYPGSKANYFTFNCWTSANLHARFCLWATSALGAGNQIFNVMNGDTESFQNLWPRLAQRFGCKVPDPLFPNGGVSHSAGYKKYESTTIPLHNKPPLKIQASTLGLSSDPVVDQPSTLFLQVDPIRWAQRADVNEAWARLRDKYCLDQNA